MIAPSEASPNPILNNGSVVQHCTVLQLSLLYYPEAHYSARDCGPGMPKNLSMFTLQGQQAYTIGGYAKLYHKGRPQQSLLFTGTNANVLQNPVRECKNAVQTCRLSNIFQDWSSISWRATTGKRVPSLSCTVWGLASPWPSQLCKYSMLTGGGLRATEVTLAEIVRHSQGWEVRARADCSAVCEGLPFCRPSVAALWLNNVYKRSYLCQPAQKVC